MSINCENMLPELKDCNFHIACDVDNPLCGENGCSHIFGPQKGATPELVEQMDVWMARYAQLSRFYNCDPDYPGSGAAGGLGFAFRTFLHGNLEPGINIVLDEIGIESQMKTADVVITGEGRLDGQTVRGKAPIGVARLARKYGKPFSPFPAPSRPMLPACNQAGITAFFPILRQVSTLEDAMKPVNAQKNMCDTVEQVFRLLKLK